MTTARDEDWLTWSDFQVGDVFVHRHQGDTFVIVGRSSERFDTFGLETGLYKPDWLPRAGLVPRGYDVYRDGEWLSTT